MIRLFKLFCVVLLMSLYGCNRINDYNNIRRVAGKTITFPIDMKFVDGYNPYYVNVDSAKATFLFWIDNTQCSTCHLSNLGFFNKVFDFCRDSVENVNVMILFTPSDDKREDFMDVAYYREREMPIYIDENDSFSKMNSFIPKDIRYHSFLLNSRNEIILVGDPTADIAIWDLYKKVVYSLEKDL